MRQLSTLFTGLMVLLIAQADATELRTKSRARKVSCTALCAELGNLIRSDPDKLVMGLEDALVVSESCMAEIISTAIDAVNADPRRVRQIYETAVKVIPHRRDEAWQAVRRFTVPAALRLAQPVMEVRRAELPSSQPETALEVRRAQAPGADDDVPIPEVRRAEVPASSTALERSLKADAPAPSTTVPMAKSVKKKTAR